MTSAPEGLPRPTAGAVTVYFLGPGFGESQVVVLPDDRVLVVDGCSREGVNHPEAVLRALGRTRIDLLVLTHPECPPDVVLASDFSASTNAMSKYVRESGAPHYLILTECSMADNIAADNPGKDIVRMCTIRCPHMNEITMEDTLEALKKLQYKAVVPEEIRVRALKSVQRMLEIG